MYGWPQRLTTTAMLSSAKDDYLVDEIKLPLQNPWRRSIRLAAIDFFKAVAVPQPLLSMVMSG